MERNEEKVCVGGNEQSYMSGFIRMFSNSRAIVVYQNFDLWNGNTLGRALSLGLESYFYKGFQESSALFLVFTVKKFKDERNLIIMCITLLSVKARTKTQISWHCLKCAFGRYVNLSSGSNSVKFHFICNSSCSIHVMYYLIIVTFVWYL